jgi:3-hydroxyacyl-CoA dehydrogenase
MTTNVHDERSDLRLPDFFTADAAAQMAGRQNQRRLLQESKKRRDGKEDERWRSIGRRWNIIRDRSRSSPRSTWPRISKTPERASACCSALTAASAERRQGGSIPCGRLSDLWTYSANRVPEISNSIVEIDRAMRLGFNWELGPFELWDAAGVKPRSPA